MPKSAGRGDSKPVRVLIVHADPDAAFEIALQLESAGFTVCGFVVSGVRALRSVSLLEPDLMLVDVDLSGRPDAIEMATALRMRDRRVHIIFMAGYDRAAVARIRAFRPDARLLKAVGRREIEAALLHAIEADARTWH
jgi:CheY-like chemotaxis protein